MLIFSLLVFVSVTLALAGLYGWWVPSQAQRRVQALAPAAQGASWQASVVRWAGPLAKLSIPEGDGDNSPLRLKFLQAGIRGDDAPLLYFAAKTVLPLGLAALAFLALGRHLAGSDLLLALSSLALLGCYLPNLLLWMRSRARRRQIFEAFPDAADLLLICMEAGLGLDAAMTRVAQELVASSPTLAEELHLTNLEIRAGATRERALQHLALRTGVEEVGQFALMLKQAEKFGTRLGDSLRVYSDDLRHKRMVRAEEAAAKIPTQLLLPMVLFIFPSIIMVVLGPAMIRIVRTLVPMIGGVAG